METLLIALGALLLATVLALAVLLTRGRDAARRLAAETRLAAAETRNQVLAAQLEAALSARLETERDLATTRQRLLESERRGADFERFRQDSLVAAKAAVLETAQQLSSKLIEDHKRENAESRTAAEERVRQASGHLLQQVETIAKTVAALDGQVQEKGRVLDTVWRALSSPGGAGQFAEIGLANTLKSFGLEPGRDYVLQRTTEDEATGRRLRPDAVVFLPADGALVIDCKASKFLIEIAAADAPGVEEEAYRNLARTMNLHLRALAEKDYRGAVLAEWQGSGRAGDIARIVSVMYLPNDAALEKLNRADPEFLRKAREAQIIPGGPAVLHCALSLAAAEINTLRQIEGQQRIAEMTQQLLDGVILALGHAAAVGRGLKAAAESFSKLAGSVNQRLLPRARKLAQLGLQPSKPIPANLPAYAVTGLERDTLIEGEAEEVVDAEPPPLAKPRLVAE